MSNRKSEFCTRARVLHNAALGAVTGAALLAGTPSLFAQCNSNFVGAGITPIVNGAVYPPGAALIPGQIVFYRVNLFVPPPIGEQTFCDVTGGQMSVTFPDGNTNPPPGQLVQVAGFGGATPPVPTFGDGFPFIIDTPISYTVDAADESPAGFVTARVDYGSTAIRPGQTNGTFQSTPPLQSASATASISTPFELPDIDIEKSVEPSRVCANVPTLVTYTFTVIADGDTPMSNVVVSDPDCDSAIIGPSGDTNGNSILDLGETWTYTCTRTITSAVPVVNTADVSANGVADNGRIVDSIFYTDEDSATVTINPAPPCNITGPTTVCEGSQNVNYSGPAGQASYLWSTIGAGCAIDGANNTQSVVIDFSTGACTINLEVSNEPGCENECNLPVVVAPCPVCKEITTPTAPPDCGSTGNPLSADVNNETPTTTFTWSVTDGPCVITSGQGTTSIQYDIPGDCAVEVCCTFLLVVDDPNDNAPASECSKEVCCTPCQGGEGRTPGFWKQPHHFGHWPDQWCPDEDCGCTPTQFCAVFNCAGAGAGCVDAVNAAYANKTLLEVISQGGGGFKALGRHAVAGLLNSGVDPALLDYAFSTAEVIAMVNNAIATCQTQPAHGDLADNNELEGGSLGGQSFCTDLNLDGAVNNNDLNILMGNWGHGGRGDIDNNGVVGTKDLSILLSNWGSF